MSKTPSLTPQKVIKILEKKELYAG